MCVCVCVWLKISLDGVVFTVDDFLVKWDPSSSSNLIRLHSMIRL